MINRFLSLILLVSLFVLTGCSVIFPIVAPFADLPEPSGPYTVATLTTCWIDSARDETFTRTQDFRKIVVQVWYPISKAGPGIPKLYIDDPKLRLPALAKQLRLPVTLFKHFDEVRTHSYTSPLANGSEEKFPVILFSHGLSGMRFQNTALMEELASQGYVVFAADHSYAANITIFPDGSTAQYRAGSRRVIHGNQLENIDLSQIIILVGDLRFIIDKINEKHSDPFLKNLPYDPARIGVIGHSLGGAAILNAMAIDDRIQAAMVLDGWYIPIPDSIIIRGIDKPIFHLGQKEWLDGNNYQRMDQLMSHSRGPIFKLLIPQTQHTDFTDMPLFTPFSQLIGYTKISDPVWLNDLIRRSTVSFFNTYLKHTDPASLKTLINEERGVDSYIFIPATP